MKAITIIFLIISSIMISCEDAGMTNPEETKYGKTKLIIQNVSEFDTIGLYIHDNIDDYKSTENLTPDGFKRYDEETKTAEFIELDECIYTRYIYVTFTRKRSDTDSTVIAVTTTQPLKLNTHSGLSTLSLLEDDFYFKRTKNGDKDLTCRIQ